MITINVETLEDCRADCIYFRVEENHTFGNNKILTSQYKCCNLELCKKLKRQREIEKIRKARKRND